MEYLKESLVETRLVYLMERLKDVLTAQVVQVLVLQMERMRGFQTTSHMMGLVKDKVMGLVVGQ